MHSKCYCGSEWLTAPATSPHLGQVLPKLIFVWIKIFSLHSLKSWCSYVLDKFQNILKKEANNTTTFHAKKKVERKEEEGEKGKENKQVHGEYEDDTINNETTNSNNNEKVRIL